MICYHKDEGSLLCKIPDLTSHEKILFASLVLSPKDMSTVIVLLRSQTLKITTFVFRPRLRTNHRRIRIPDEKGYMSFLFHMCRVSARQTRHDDLPNVPGSRPLFKTYFPHLQSHLAQTFKPPKKLSFNVLNCIN